MRRRPTRLLLIALLLASACFRRRTGNPTPSDVTSRRTLPADSVYVLGLDTDLPADTTVTISPGRPRAVVLRHPTDRATFAVVEFGDSSLAGGQPVEVTFHPRPGTYGLDISATGPIREGTITFKYARHFVAPPEARAHFGTDVIFERRLAVGRLGGDGTIVLLPTRRPTADNVAAALEGPGTYLVAGPR
jgi:hypothetical protein